MPSSNGPKETAPLVDVVTLMRDEGGASARPSSRETPRAQAAIETVEGLRAALDTLERLFYVGNSGSQGLNDPMALASAFDIPDPSPQTLHYLQRAMDQLQIRTRVALILDQLVTCRRFGQSMVRLAEQNRLQKKEAQTQALAQHLSRYKAVSQTEGLRAIAEYARQQGYLHYVEGSSLNTWNTPAGDPAASPNTLQWATPNMAPLLITCEEGYIDVRARSGQGTWILLARFHN